MESTSSSTESGGLRKGLRDRLNQTNAAAALSAETLERLASLPDSLNETTATIYRELEETADRVMSRLRPLIAELLQRTETLTVEAHQRLAEQQRVLTETERNLAHTVEMLRRQADRTGWMQTGVVVLALTAGTLGGAAGALLILGWLQ